MTKRAVFLDRDGTLIEHYDYLTSPDQVKLKPTTAPALRLLKKRDFLLVLVTNQSAVGRGMITETQLAEIHNRLKELLAQQGIYLDAIYYCPYHPEAAVEKYRCDSDLRKPKPGMFKLAAEELDIDLEQSWMVGDDDRDILAGQAAGCRTIFIESYQHSSLVRAGQSQPDYQTMNLREAANLIIRYADRPQPDQTPQSQPPAPAPPALAPEPQPQMSSENIPETTPQPQTVSSDQLEQSTPQTQPEQHQTQTEKLPVPIPAKTNPLDHPGSEDEFNRQTSSPNHQKAKPKKRLRKKIVKKKNNTEKLPDNETLHQILRELKIMNRERHYTEFSIFFVFAAIVQMLVFLCLVLVVKFRIAAEPDIEATQTCLSLAMIFQTLTLTLLVLHRKQ